MAAENAEKVYSQAVILFATSKDTHTNVLFDNDLADRPVDYAVWKIAVISQSKGAI